jgi:diadenosine tetraphosphate (Ap4A) HIT family hydrolase
VAETPEQLYERAVEALVMPPVEEWQTFPFDGEIRPRRLKAPAAADTQRRGAGGVDCCSCWASDDEYLWASARWRLRGLDRPSGLPVVVLLEPREHVAEPGDLSDELASELGVMIARVERAVRSVGEIGRVHVCRWGDGGEHLHWWFMARPARMPQLVGSFAAVWDDILPPTPEHIWRANLQHVVRQMDSCS